MQAFWINFKVMKILGKYFLAIVPPDDILEKAESIKLGIKENFGVKYSLKSPAHITLKMPFSYNENKEEELRKKLESFLSSQMPFLLQIGGIKTFGKRVVFIDIEKSDPLLELQANLKLFCKRELHLPDELSDRNYHPHMTLAFKDLKESKFEGVLKFAQEKALDAEFSVADLVLLKRIENRWVIYFRIPFSGED